MQQQQHSSELLRLWERYLNKTATDVERHQLNAVLATEEGALLLQQISESVDLVPASGLQLGQEQSAGMLENMQQAINGFEAAENNSKPLRMRRLAWIAAASVIILLGAGIFLWKTDKKETEPVVVAKPVEIAPGRQGAILTLANGSKVMLDTIQNGEVALQGGAIARIVNGTLFYEAKGDEVVYNTMSTPIGRQFQLTLPDGTKVWLNAASSIRYPTIFAGTERRVEVSGESYFEVAKNTKMPFRVVVNNRAVVEVLGTEFNINSYSNERTLNTTLLQGAVKVRRGAESVVLRPGEQAQLQEKIKVENNVDVDQVMAWKNGLFNFNGLKLEDVMRQLERWYEIDVVYEKGIPNIVVGGEMSKDITLNGLLIVLQKLELHYRLEGRKLVILP